MYAKESKAPPTKEELPSELAKVVELGLKKAPQGGGGAAYQVEYSIFQHGKEKKMSSGACFAQLGVAFTENKEYDEDAPLWFSYKPSLTTPAHQKMLVPWLRLLQNVNLLQDKRAAEEIAQTGIILQIDNKISPFDFYTQASFVRYIREQPNLVEFTLNAVDAGGHFWASLFYGHCIGFGTNSGHSIICPPPYGVKAGALAVPISLNRNAMGKEKIDTRSLLSILQEFRKKKKDNAGYYYAVVPWEAHKRIANLGFGCSSTVKQEWRLLDPRLYPLYQVKNPKELTDVLTHIKEEHPDVKID